MKKNGITKASVSVSTMKGRFSYQAEKLGPRDIIKMLESLGFQAELSSRKNAAEQIGGKSEIKKWALASSQGSIEKEKNQAISNLTRTVYSPLKLSSSGLIN